MNHSQKREMGNGRDLFGLRKDGTQFPVEAGLNPFVLHNHRYVMSLVTDITVRKENERQIADLNDHLEEKIEERTDSLNKAVEQLKKEVSLRIHAENNTKEALQKEKELNELKTKFLSLVSHEFKTPISGILTSATLIGKYTTEEQQEKREKHLNTIKSKVKYLNTIIDDFLSLERLDTGKAIYKTTSFPLSKVLNEVVYDANLSNLIHNAIKYSGEGSLVIIEVNELPEHLEIKIKDQGIGIPQQEQHSIFDRYFRAENVLLTPGTGIGLNIVQNHLRNLDATISFISRAGKGSTFRILIPVVYHEKSTHY